MLCLFVFQKSSIVIPIKLEKLESILELGFQRLDYLILMRNNYKSAKFCAGFISLHGNISKT